MNTFLKLHESTGLLLFHKTRMTCVDKIRQNTKIGPSRPMFGSGQRLPMPIVLIILLIAYSLSFCFRLFGVNETQRGTSWLKDSRAKARNLPLAECCTVDGKLASTEIVGAGSSSASLLLVFDLLHDAFLLGDDFWREAPDEGVIGQGGSGLRECIRGIHDCNSNYLFLQLL